MALPACHHRLMKTDVCGYGVGAVEAETGQRITAVYGFEPGCIDVGRDDDGELRSFVTTSAAQVEDVKAGAAPKLFDPPAATASVILGTPGTKPVSFGSDAQLSATPNAWLVATVHRGKERAHELLTGSRRKTAMMGAGGGLAAVVVALALIPPAGSSQSTAVPETNATASVNGSSTPIQPDLSDPQNASIEMALTGAIAGLGNMQGVARSAVKASIVSRAGDIVLIDLAVTKPTGLTAFATVLLQKVGSQWRMRQIIDERN